MIKYNPLLKSNGTQNGALLVAPSDSIVFDVPGKCIWVKGVKLLGTDHTYSFSNDNYITLTNTPGDPEDIKIGVNINNLLSELDKVRLYIGENNNTAANAQVGNPYIKLFYNNARKQTFLIKSANDTNLTVTTDSDGNIIIENTKPDLNHNTDYRVSQLKSTDASDFRVLLKSTANDTNETNSVKYSQYLTFNPNTKILKINSSLVVTMADIYVGATSSTNATAGLVPAAASAQRAYYLRGDGTWAIPDNTNTWRPVKVEGTQKLASTTDTDALDFHGDTGIEITYDATNKKINIKNTAPDINHNTDFNVQQTPKTDNVNRPLMMINGGTSAGELITTSMFSTGIYANAYTNTIYATMFDGAEASLTNTSRQFFNLNLTVQNEANQGPWIMLKLNGVNKTGIGWNNNVGMFFEHYLNNHTYSLLAKGSSLTYDGQTLLHSGNYTSYLGYIGTTAVQSNSANQSLTGIINITSTKFLLGNLSVSGRSNLLLNSPENTPTDIIFRSGSYTNNTWGDWAISSRGNEGGSSGNDNRNSFVIARGSQNSGTSGENICFKISNDVKFIIGSGIFYTNPQYQLDVRGTIGGTKYYSTTSGTVFYDYQNYDIVNTGSDYLDIGFGSSRAGKDVYLEGKTIYFRVNTNNSAQARILSDGKFGIGTTSPSYRLDVVDSYANGSPILRVTNNKDTQSCWGIMSIFPNQLVDYRSFPFLFGKTTSKNNMGDIGFIYKGDQSFDNAITVGFYSNDNIIGIKANATVGINTINPQYRLDIYTTSDNGIRIYNTDATKGVSLKVGDNTPYMAFAGTSFDIVYNSTNCGEWNGNNRYFTVLSGGNIGINDSNPAYKFTVKGTSYLNGVRIGRDFSISNRATIRLDANGDAPQDIIFSDTANANEGGWTGAHWVISSRQASENYVFGIWTGSGNPNHQAEDPGLIIHPTYRNVKIGESNGSFPIDRGYKLWVNGTVYSASGFYKGSSSNDYVLLGGGDHSKLKTINNNSLFGTGNILIGTGYDAEIDYIKTSGTQYIDTKFKPTSTNIRVVAEASFESNRDDDNLIGSYDGSRSYPISIYQNNIFYGITDKNVGLTDGKAVISDNDLHVIDVRLQSGHQEMWIDGILKRTSTKTYSSISNSYNWYIFARNSGSAGYYTYSKLKSLRIYDNGKIVRDYIAVRVGTIGYLFDRIEQKLYANAGSGVFELGNDSGHLPLTGGTMYGNIYNLKNSIHSKGFYHSDVNSNSYILLAGGGYKSSSDFLERAGGQMLGPLTWKNNTALPEDTTADYILTVSAFASGGTTMWASKATLKTSLGLSDYMLRASDTFWGTHTYTGSNHIFETTSTGTLTIFKHTGSGTPVPFRVSESSSTNNEVDDYGVLLIERLNTSNGWNNTGAGLYFMLKNNKGNSEEVAGISGINTQNGKLIFRGRNRAEIGSMDVSSFSTVGSISAPGATFTNTSRTFFDLKQTATNTSSLGPYIRFFMNSTEKCRVGWNDTYGMFLEHTYNGLNCNLVGLGTALTYCGNTILRSDNYTDYVYSKSTSDSRYIPEPTRDGGTGASTYSFRTYHTSTETGINFRRGTSEKFWVGTYDDNGYLYNGSYFRLYSNRITWPNPLVLSSDGAAASGKLLVSGSYSNGTGLVRLENTNSGNYLWGINFTTPNLTANQTNFALLFGKANSTNNLFDIGFKWVGDGSTSNTMTMGFYNNDFLTYLKANGNFGIGVDPSYRLHAYGTSASFDVPIQVISNGSSGSWLATSAFLTPNMVAGNYNGIEIGRSMNSGNVGHISFYYAGNDSADNRFALGFYNYIDLLVVKRNGNVGIGTASPSLKLQVNGDARINGIALGNNFSITNRASIRLDPANTGYPADIIFGKGTFSSGWSNAYWVISSRSASENKVFGIWRADGNDGGSEQPGLIIHPNLNVKIGEVNGSFATDRGYKLWINGNCAATHFYESSDIRLKHDISSISQSIRKFKFNDDNKLYYGFIAQELETLHPELVDSSGEYKTVNYNSAICYYIAELENKVQKLEERIRKFESSLA